MSEGGGDIVKNGEIKESSLEKSKTPELPKTPEKIKTPEPTSKTPESSSKSPEPSSKTPEPSSKTPEPSSKTPEPLQNTENYPPAPDFEPFNPYDETGKPKPFVCICPPKLPDPDESTQNDALLKTDDTGKDESTNNSESKESTASSTDSKCCNKSFSEQFKLFSKFGDIKSDGKLLSLSQSDKWMKQAKVIDGKKITTTDTGIHFKKLKSIKLTETDYKKFLDDLAKTKKINIENLKKKMVECGPPGLTSSQPAGSKHPSAVERLTDTSKYTGSHKQRFDETGKGRGIAGRKDLHDNSGYVSGYLNKNTYDKKNPTK